VEGEVLGLIVTVTVIICGVAVLLMAMVNRRKMLEMKHRERLAMIERGMLPPPEVDPNGFERRALGMRPPSRSSVRFRSAGVLMIGVGLALMLLISYAGDSPEPGIGVGGAFAVVGAALLLNGLFSARDEDPGVANASTTTTPREPPPTVAP
jgi:hypothetical protein